LETVPLYLLYEASILIAALVGTAHRVQPEQGDEQAAGAGDPARDPARPQAQDSPGEQTVQELIDHIDPELSD